MITILMFILGIAFFLVSIFLILIVLIQPGGQKGGGLGGLGGGSAGGAISETLGATEGEKTLARWTAIGMGVFFVLAIILTVMGNFLGSALDLDGAPAPATQQAPAAAGAGETIEIDPANIMIPSPDEMPMPEQPATGQPAPVTPTEPVTGGLSADPDSE